MSIDIIFFFLLGFIASGFLGLMLGTFVWRRAVRLTQRRFEASTPLTLHEIRADNEQMRAEFALMTRKLERSVSEFQARATAQLKEIARDRTEPWDVNTAPGLAEERVAGTVAVKRVAEEALAKKEFEVDELTSQVARQEMLPRGREDELVDPGSRLVEMENDYSGLRVDSGAKEDRIETVRGELDDLRRQTRDDTRKLGELRASLKERTRQYEGEQERADTAEKRLDQFRRDLADTQAALERRLREVKRLKTGQRKQGGDGVRKLRVQVDQLEADMVKKDAALAEMALLNEELKARAEDHGVKAAISVLEAEKEILRDNLSELMAENVRLSEENERLQSGVGGDWDDERRDNAVLRERLNDVAVQVTRMVAALEGNDSVIDKILADMNKSVANDGGPETALGAKMRALASHADRGAAE